MNGTDGMTALTPQQMRELAELPTSNFPLYNVDIRAALRTAADQLEAVPTREQVLDAITHGNPYSTCDFEEEIADRIMAILTADTAPQDRK